MKLSARGFTLIELLVVIAIIAVLSVVGIAVFRGVTSAAQDARRKGDVDSIAKAYEIKANGGAYAAVGDSDFSSGKKPADPGKGNYFNYLANDKSGYKVCAALDKNPVSYCNTPATNCYCKFSSQSTLSSSSNASNADSSSTNFGSGPGGGSSSSCDPNGSLSSGLVGYWKMDEGTGTTTADSVGNNTGTLTNGPTWTVGISGSALNFDGVDDYVNFGSATWDLTNFSASLWWNETLPTLTNGWSGPIQYRLSNKGFQMVNNANSTTSYTPHLVIWNGSSEVGQYYSATTYSYPFSTYRHFVWTYDSSTVPPTAKLFVDGVNQTVNSGGASNYGSGGGFIGKGFSSTGGKIDDVRIYNRVLSGGFADSEISLLYGGCVVP